MMTDAYSDLVNLASAALGAKVVFATDEWFASAENMLKDEDPVWKADVYTPFGKWMDGWESRRRRTAGHDWSIVKLGLSGRVSALEINTQYFTGNFSPRVSVYGLRADHVSVTQQHAIDRLLQLRKVYNNVDYGNDKGKEDDKLVFEEGRMGTCASDEEWNVVQLLASDQWEELLPLSPLQPGYDATCRSFFPVQSTHTYAYLRVNMGPDGGIARVKVYGQVTVNVAALPVDEELDLVAVEVGGQAVGYSNRHYGHPRQLLLPGRGQCMGDGWETARQPKRPPVYVKDSQGLLLLPGYDWAVLQLGVPGIAHRLIVDTHFYKGNYPESCMIEYCCAPLNDEATHEAMRREETHSQFLWQPLLPRTPLTPNAEHHFSLTGIGIVTYIKLTIYPDGGVMRLRLYGHRTPDSRL